MTEIKLCYTGAVQLMIEFDPKSELESESVPEAKDDIHRAELSRLHKRPVQLKEEDQQCCIKLIETLGLKYGTIDFIVNKEGHLTEVNPTGDWANIERETHLPITNAFVDLIDGMIGIN